MHQNILPDAQLHFLQPPLLHTGPAEGAHAARPPSHARTHPETLHVSTVRPQLRLHRQSAEPLPAVPQFVHCVYWRRAELCFVWRKLCRNVGPRTTSVPQARRTQATNRWKQTAVYRPRLSVSTLWKELCYVAVFNHTHTHTYRWEAIYLRWLWE